MPEINDIKELSAPVLLALFLNVVGVIVARTAIENKWIPLILMLSGGILYPLIEPYDSGSTLQYPLIKQFVVGVCIGGLSVGLNQTLRQFIPNKKDENTPPSSN